MHAQQPRRRRRRATRAFAVLLIGVVAACAAACGGSSDDDAGDAIRSAAVAASERLPPGVRKPTLYQIQRAREILREEQEKVVPDDLAQRTVTAVTLAVQACPLAAAGIEVGERSPQQLVWDGNVLVRELIENYPLARNIGLLSLYPGVTSVSDLYVSYSDAKMDGGCVSRQETTIEHLNSNWMLMRLFENALADWPDSITANVNRNEAFFLVLAKRRVPPERSGFPTPQPARSPEGAVRAFLAAPPPEVIYAFEWSRVLQGYELGPVETDGRGNARVCIAANRAFPMTEQWPEGGYSRYGYYLTEGPAGWLVSEVTGNNFQWPLEDRPSPAPSSLWDSAPDWDCPLRPS